MSLTTTEILALEYHTRTELFDRTLPGCWSDREPECWIPFSMSASGRHAQELRKELRIQSGDPLGFTQAIRWTSRFTYSQQKRMLS